jgi:membrane protease YdiL (CAAX protease family)
VYSHRCWTSESVVLLAAKIVISVSAGMLAALVLRGWWSGLPVGQVQFYTSMISGFSFQGATLVFTHFFLRQNSTSWKEFLGLNDAQLKSALLRALAVTVVVLPAALLLRVASDSLLSLLGSPSEMQPALQIIKLSVSTAQLVYAGVAAILIAPVAEEILFRGILYSAIKERGWPKTALISSSLVFSAIHGHIPSFLSLALLGAVFALLYDRTANLLAPILCHAAFNAVNFFVFIFS